MNDQFIQGVIFDWNRIDNDSYLKEIEAFNGVEKLDFNKSITFFVGENGSGKSTLLEAIAIAHGFNPEGGTKNYVFSTHDTHSELCDAIKISKGYRKEKWGYFLRAESFYNVATQEENYADLKHPSAKYHEKSHGESFLALAQDNLHPNGLYLFDEPEAALSPQRQLTLLMQIYRFAKERQHSADRTVERVKAMATIFRQLRMKSHNLQSQMVLHRIKTGNMILWNEEKWRQKETITIYIITFSS